MDFAGGASPSTRKAWIEIIRAMIFSTFNTVAFHTEGLLDLHDVNKTFEKFDMFLPKWVVSRRVYDFLISKYPRMNFEPIFLK